MRSLSREMRNSGKKMKCKAQQAETGLKWPLLHIRPKIIVRSLCTARSYICVYISWTYNGLFFESQPI